MQGGMGYDGKARAALHGWPAHQLVQLEVEVLRFRLRLQQNVAPEEVPRAVRPQADLVPGHKLRATPVAESEAVAARGVEVELRHVPLRMEELVEQHVVVFGHAVVVRCGDDEGGGHQGQAVVTSVLRLVQAQRTRVGWVDEDVEVRPDLVRVQVVHRLVEAALRSADDEGQLPSVAEAEEANARRVQLQGISLPTNHGEGTLNVHQLRLRIPSIDRRAVPQHEGADSLQVEPPRRVHALALPGEVVAAAAGEDQHGRVRTVGLPFGDDERSDGGLRHVADLVPVIPLVCVLELRGVHVAPVCAAK
mmetsp:Transcript_134405/g.417723  ORF Transcript_134405/g.417723 Transcript_134405/m.417723 type:complete len:306 (-) Transcript_134405:354-1271(-)